MAKLSPSEREAGQVVVTAWAEISRGSHNAAIPPSVSEAVETADWLVELMDLHIRGNQRPFPCLGAKAIGQRAGEMAKVLRAFMHETDRVLVELGPAPVFECGGVVLAVSDHGPSFPSGFEPTAPGRTGLGMRSVSTLSRTGHTRIDPDDCRRCVVRLMDRTTPAVIQPATCETGLGPTAPSWCRIAVRRRLLLQASLRFAAASLPRSFTTSMLTRCPSFSPVSPAAWTAVMWTNTSFPPPSGWLKPKPLSALNYFTLPVAT